MPRPLTAKQLKFIQEYQVDWNATQAAIRAGYSQKTANVQGTQNLIKLSDYIEGKKKESAEKTADTIEQLDKDILAAWEISSKVYRDKRTGQDKMVDPVMAKACLEMRGRRKAAFVDKVQHDVKHEYTAILSGAQNLIDAEYRLIEASGAESSTVGDTSH